MSLSLHRRRHQAKAYRFFNVYVVPFTVVAESANSLWRVFYDLRKILNGCRYVKPQHSGTKAKKNAIKLTLTLPHPALRTKND